MYMVNSELSLCCCTGDVCDAGSDRHYSTVESKHAKWRIHDKIHSSGSRSSPRFGTVLLPLWPSALHLLQKAAQGNRFFLWCSSSFHVIANFSYFILVFVLFTYRNLSINQSSIIYLSQATWPIHIFIYWLTYLLFFTDYKLDPDGVSKTGESSDKPWWSSTAWRYNAVSRLRWADTSWCTRPAVTISNRAVQRFSVIRLLS